MKRENSGETGEADDTARRTPIHRRLDELIEWYEAHDPLPGRTIRVAVKRRTAMRYGAKPATRGGALQYRNCALSTREDYEVTVRKDQAVVAVALP